MLSGLHLSGLSGQSIDPIGSRGSNVPSDLERRGLNSVSGSTGPSGLTGPT